MTDEEFIKMHEYLKLQKILIKFWDFIYSESIANRKEYTSQEQIELTEKFLNNNNQIFNN